MRYASIRKMDISNGKGIGVSLFVQGCTHHCDGCFNPETWNFDSGKEWTKDIENEFIDLCKVDYIDHVSILGGEPFDQNYKDITAILKRIKSEVDKPIWIWSGYTFEEIKEIIGEYNETLLDYIDILVDGTFQQDKKDLTLAFRGSSNQRIIDVQRSLQKGEIVLYELLS